MEGREQIVNHIKNYRAQDVKLFYEIMVKILLNNIDFHLVKNVEKEDLISIIEEQTGKKMDYHLGTIIGKEALKIFSEIEDHEFSKTKLKKTQRVGLIADVLGDDTLFEGFCLAFHDTDDMLSHLFETFGCLERYNKLAQCAVYQKRKKYIRKIADYAKAAVNLYGVIHVTELEALILEYENENLLDFNGYNHADKTYKNTIMFTPEFLCTCSLHQLIGNLVPTICTTLDGFFLHISFMDEYQNEQEKMMQFFKETKHELTENDFDYFFNSVSDSSYRILYECAGSKQMYLPSKKEFLRYADEIYYEITDAEIQMRRYIEKKLLPNFENIAQKVGITVKECIDDFMNELHYQATDMRTSGEKRDPHEYVQFVFASMQGYDIDFEDIDQANEFLGYAMKIMNSVRLWSNHGCTPDELFHQPKAYLRNTTIVPGTSHAATMLAKEREQLNQMGINVDLDATATNVPSIFFKNGINGTTTKNTKKIHPNDLCPCGSGKKFKKCCGSK